MEKIKRFEPRKRMAIDGKTWWYVFDNKIMNYSTLICFGKYKTKKDCQYAIDRFYELSEYINK